MRGKRSSGATRAGAVPRVGDASKYARRACEDVVVQVPAPPRLIEGGLTQPTKASRPPNGQNNLLGNDS